MWRAGAMRPDYDSDPQRWRAWQPRRDVHHLVAPMLAGPVLDVGCGDGRLAALLRPGVAWVGLDSSPTQLAANPYRPVVLGDMRALPLRDGLFAEVTMLWCLYHVADPVTALRDAARVMRPGGWLYVCTSARDNDPELVPEGYLPTTFDAEEAVGIVSTVFDEVHEQRWDRTFYPLTTRAEVRAYCRQHLIPEERADNCELPLWLTKRGVLIRASLGSS